MGAMGSGRWGSGRRQVEKMLRLDIVPLSSEGRSLLRVAHPVSKRNDLQVVGKSALYYAQFICRSSTNLGDDIQSLAAARLLPRIDSQIDREELNVYRGDGPTCLIMNAWFMHKPDTWPPSNSIHPIFVGFHASTASRGAMSRHADYLRRHSPIGARDRDTADFLNSIGVQADVSLCLTLTFPRRAKPPALGKTIIVDADHIDIPDALRRNSISVTHRVELQDAGEKLLRAREIVEFYRDNASLVITSRLHCALPCTAMGIPVVFFANPGSRLTPFVDIGGRIYSKHYHSKHKLRRWVGRVMDPVDWSPKALDVSGHAERLRERVASGLKMAIVQ